MSDVLQLGKVQAIVTVLGVSGTCAVLALGVVTVLISVGVHRRDVFLLKVGFSGLIGFGIGFAVGGPAGGVAGSAVAAGLAGLWLLGDNNETLQ
mmetsp:Transcript_16636/g.38216  ORF Transcript_16636/g.38216 Transcript_16636/m.38216 type:complete len:94 (-) Transcript_16636:159-440(-)